jgi:hypothetical protein
MQKWEGKRVARINYNLQTKQKKLPDVGSSEAICQSPHT